MGVRSISDRQKMLKKGAGIFILALFCVLGIALAQRNGLLDDLNIGLMGWAGQGRETALGGQVTMVMRLASAIGGTAIRIILSLVVLGALVFTGRRAAASWFAGVEIGGTLLNLILKQIFAAPRPDLLPHLDIVHSYSFPSGHAAGNMMFFGALAMLAGRRWAYGAGGAMIALIGVSRVWLGVHWPSDVMAGWIEGLGWLMLCAVWLPARRGQQ
ncbi:phosphatase PAP2 family protein [Sphingobium yanoikuyae]|jgi:undecaprenyl-diphosphatase|uniref:PAP2 family protein n=1 Tax=Sphingobium yanoikuyae TaxID=13690 RepID=A0A430BUT0_SPHYA|nr:phosphatase PAP2 family protein [Sphingobium yanoikuyae]MDH2132428.1 phosphatase PAP2 family protein [Sphingobium yanoikuyae]MDH2150334.1 phosphatase PAP2 family protein [Sphingobium yanoikuyae]MDH2167828.1 phosphatase PAP2 family protein [Sphingobium yanoikuyae]RSU56538.1 PAP2 family protein [Sphingobium yanoikuyae]